MRILVVTNLFPSAAHPGFGTFVRARVDALRAHGVAVDVLAIQDAATHRRVARKYASLALRVAVRAARSRLERPGYDIVEAHIAYPTGLVARIAATIAGAPLVLFAHGADVLEVPWRSARHTRLARWTYRGAALVIANSAFLAGRFRAGFPEAADKVQVVSPGIELARFTAAAERTPAGARAGIVYAGRLIPEKGVDVLLRAIAANAGRSGAWQLTVIGEGPERERLAALAADLGVAVSFTGASSRDAVAGAMAAAAVVAVPSVYEEPLGLVALEGMAAGAIVVASATGGLTEIVDDGVNGYAAPPGDVGRLGDALAKAMAAAADPATAAQVRARALERAGAHDVTTAVRRSLDLYEAVCR